MKKLIGLINDFPEYTGSGNYAFSLFNELKKIEEIEMNYINYEKNKLNHEKIIEEKPINFPFLKRTLNSIYFKPKKIEKYNIIHCSNQMLSNYAKFNEKTIITCLDLIPLQNPKEYPFTTSFFLKKAVKSMNKAKKIITISEYSKQKLIELSKINSEKIIPIHLGINKEIFFPKNKIECRKKTGLPINTKIILNVGSEEKRKNITLALEALNEIKKKFNKVLFIRVGEQRKETIQKINELKLQKNVIYFNNIDEKILSEIYSSADALLFTSQYEGFGLPVLESMACGTPVLCKNTTAVPEVAGNAGIYAENVEEFAKKAIELIENKKLKEKASKKCIEQAKKFSWEKCAKETIKVYEEVK